MDTLHFRLETNSHILEDPQELATISQQQARPPTVRTMIPMQLVLAMADIRSLGGFVLFEPMPSGKYFRVHPFCPVPMRADRADRIQNLANHIAGNQADLKVYLAVERWL